MRKIIILIFAVFLIIFTYNHYSTGKQKVEETPKDKTSIAYRIEEENNLIIDDNPEVQYTEDLTTYIADIDDELKKTVVNEELKEDVTK